MALSGSKADASPMMDINTTPLIDVMLVLLIMFIITIPVATNAINFDLPQQGGTPPPVPMNAMKNRLVLTAQNTILWNGTPITEGDLVSLLEATKAYKEPPELQFQPEEFASYPAANRLMRIITVSKVPKFGFVGNEQYAGFRKN
ncbi:biopolymer transporter ExbD [Novosphingobium sp. AAP93]|uniref:ExbD/TolR family protein n=1 Tax=Novosphingobium sp. AAP93 TaxID=1523427 RepID=UPI0006B9D690|nr:biopolymer transporter ExbD [Novosphingobium sp. AAP93]KPF83605.1 biopolymer transporter ExbD [Novosphingobium sp. AAP93]